MKRFISGISILSLVFIIAACGSGIKGDKAETGDAQQEQLTQGEKTLKADLSLSNIEWVGSKPGGQHNGTLSISEGTLELSDGVLLGGSFVIDMNTITVLDITDEEMNANLRGHLMSDDFFAVESFPTASFVITNVEAKAAEGVTHRLTGNLTIRGIVRSVSFDANVRISEGKFVATTPQFILDRTEWNVQYGSKKIFANLKDQFINDEMGIVIHLTATME